FAIFVLRENGQSRLRGAEWQFLVLELESRSEDRVLERVLSLGHLGRNDSGLTRLPKPVQPLAVVASRCVFFGRAKGIELLPAEEVAIADDDFRPLGDLLFADPYGPALLRAVVEVAPKLGFVLGGGANGCSAHGRCNLANRRCEPTDGLGELGDGERL